MVDESVVRKKIVKIKRSIIHRIHDGKGGEREVKLTPFKAIRYFCNECMGGQFIEIERCTAKLCPLYPYRAGRGSQPDIVFPQTPSQEHE